MTELVSFNAWIRAVDALIAHRVGLTHRDLPDWLWADHFEDGASPEEAVDEFFEELADDGFPDPG